ncbi:putative O-methyltransferase YrrM [Lewinella marina]|uniref:Methyltransferase n=1 Tax=Neolewinella marina TaxID=438751 RepID=A0A2G0CFB6_9BACT|nr:methyltransferase [Neolewinella marina]NJB85642.1 putative O-methyltransferase YrrM [Neolewinella marina]PHK98673.1 methyltransferase [Neolewinella marina]
MTPIPTVAPDRILQTGFGFWAAKVLLSAVELDLFSYLSKGPQKAASIQKTLGLHSRSLYDFLDALVALGFLQRKGTGEDAQYANAPDVDHYLVRGTPGYIGGMLQMANNRLYPFWGNLEEALQTGQPQNESKHGEKSLFEAVYADPATLREFAAAMAGFQIPNFIFLAQSFDFSAYTNYCDVGGADGTCSCILAEQHPHLQCVTFDLPALVPIAEENIRNRGMEDRVRVESGDFFADDLPHADVITMGNILHDWSEQEKLMLLGKAYDALPEGGALLVIENVIDDKRKENLFGLLMSLNMLIETPEGFDYTYQDFRKWATKAGFRETDLIPLTGPSSAVVAFK